MTISAKHLTFDQDNMWIELTDGRTLGVPLAWFPRLLKASPDQRDQYELTEGGLHWPGVDEDISVEGLLNGFGDMSQSRHHVA